MGVFAIKKILNNNVLIATHEERGEVVLIGKGIGFNRQMDESIEETTVEKMFVLKNEKEQEQFKMLLPHIEDEMMKTIISAIELIRERTNNFLNEHIHVALTDHILFRH